MLSTNPLSVTPESIAQAAFRPGSAPFGPLPFAYSFDAPWNRDMVPLSLYLGG